MDLIALELDGARIELRNPRPGPTGEWVIVQLATILNPSAGATIPARECMLTLMDLRRMAAYIRAHVGENAPHSIGQSGTFVTYDLRFQLQGLEGGLESWADGYFTVRWMIYCGSPDRSHNRFYVGLDGQVGVAEALRWADALDELAAATKQR